MKNNFNFERIFVSSILHMIVMNLAMFAGCFFAGVEYQFQWYLCIMTPILCAIAGEWAKQQQELRNLQDLQTND